MAVAKGDYEIYIYIIVFNSLLMREEHESTNTHKRRNLFASWSSVSCHFKHWSRGQTTSWRNGFKRCYVREWGRQESAAQKFESSMGQWFPNYIVDCDNVRQCFFLRSKEDIRSQISSFPLPIKEEEKESNLNRPKALGSVIYGTLALVEGSCHYLFCPSRSLSASLNLIFWILP